MFHRQSYAGSGRERGFTLIELLASLTLGFIIVTGGCLIVGRVLVHKTDATRAAAAKGLPEPEVVSKDMVRSSRLGCGPDEEVGFLVKGKDAPSDEKPTLVCCQSWARGCHVK